MTKPSHKAVVMKEHLSLDIIVFALRCHVYLWCDDIFHQENMSVKCIPP